MYRTSLDLNSIRNHLIEKLKLRAFPHSALQAARDVQFDDRERILSGESYAAKERDVSEFFMTTKYNHVCLFLVKTLHIHWLATESDPQLYRHFKIPPMMSYVRNKSLKTTVRNRFACPDLISPFPEPSSSFQQTQSQGQAHLQTCSSKRCQVCPRLLKHAVVCSKDNTL